MTLVAILATVATVILAVIVAIKLATSAGHAVANAARRLWAWAGEPWWTPTAAAATAVTRSARTGSGHGWGAAHGRPVATTTPPAATGTTAPGRPATPKPGSTGTTTIIDPPEPTPEMQGKAAKAAARGGRVGYRVGWGTGVGAATATTAIRHGTTAAKHAWRAAHPEPAQVVNQDEIGPCPGCGVTLIRSDWDDGRSTVHHAGTEEASCAPGAKAPPAPGAASPPTTPPSTTPAEPTGLWTKESTVTYQIPSEIEDHADLIGAMEGILNDIGAGEDLSEEIAEMEKLLEESSTIHERFGRDFGVETTGKVTAFEEQAAAAKVAMEQLRAALEGMVEATTAVKDEAVVAVGS